MKRLAELKDLHLKQVEILRHLESCTTPEIKEWCINIYAGYSKQIIEIIEPADHEPTLQATFGKKEASL